MGGAAARWARELAEWRIPDEILAAAPQSPWIHPVELFRALDAPAADAPAADVPSRRRGLERLDEGGTVLDVGCGGGRAALALCPPAGMLTGVDHQQGMLDAFVDAAHSRGLAHGEILGDWPDVADRAPTADVVVCHHVVYNVAALPAFLSALDAHARRRVVLELPQTHPLSGMTPLWRHFWGLERPHGPTATGALAVVRELGLAAQLEEWEDAYENRPDAWLPTEQQVEFMRIRLCLTQDRDAELARVMAALPPVPRRLATLWWDVAG